MNTTFQPILMVLTAAKLTNLTDPDAQGVNNMTIEHGSYEEVGRRVVRSLATYKQVIGLATADLNAGCDIILYEQVGDRLMPIALNIRKKDADILPIEAQAQVKVSIDDDDFKTEPELVAVSKADIKAAKAATKVQAANPLGLFLPPGMSF